VISAFTFPTGKPYDYASGSAQPCGDTGSIGLPLALDYSGSKLLATFGSNAIAVDSCAAGKTQPLFTTSVAADNFAADNNGNVILGGPDSAGKDAIAIWSGGHVRTLHVNGVTQPTW
jgi:hypothetical protein